MKDQGKRMKFIQMRGERQSYNKIAQELKISTDTCYKWEKDLQAKIAEHKAEQLQELYAAYYMTREARIKHLGDTLKRIDDALAAVDLSELAPEKLLDYKLRYTEALKDEYLPTPAEVAAEATTTQAAVALLLAGRNE
jgi:transcriptional regulator with XRE-family HTH domain